MAACELPVALDVGEVSEIKQVMLGLMQIAADNHVTFRAVEFSTSGDSAIIYLDQLADGHLGVASVG